MPTEPVGKRGVGRRLAVALVLSAAVFLVLWIWAYSLVTAAMIASAPGIAIIVGSSASEVVEQIVDAIASMLMFALNIVGAIISAIFDMFD